MPLFTLGTQDRHDPDFIALLKQHRIDAVIDQGQAPARIPVAPVKTSAE